ncbi:hypothetical protein N8I84_41795 (plasmid) [Streptomyces cynarae]|uniref:Secreted protein n=1 Tax=Streptomyces cynarae TaxID=2981134 RepID=A0ABY6EE93_9ACTN|nr:hypothetical protein [Streptomyces cynarae]UXY24969.1 hypothetical protein N8I84_41795 [Streptomyces cynarae]
MDQGWAALLGALIGAVFGGGAAIAAAWLGRNGMKLQAQAMLQQASWQAQSTREQWRREVLRDACIELVEASRLQVHAIRRYHALVMFDQQGFDRDPDQVRRNYFERGTRTQAAGLVLELEGDHELRVAAARVLEAARGIPHLQEDHGNYPEAQEKTQHMWEATDEFVRVARTRLAL